VRSPSVSIMPDIPALTLAQAHWCVTAVEAVIGADGKVKANEARLLEELGHALGIARHSDQPAAKLEPPPEMDLEVEQYVLRLIILAGYIDGALAPEELEVIQQFATRLDVGQELLEIAYDDVREKLFISTLLADLEAVVADSSRARKVVDDLGMKMEAACAAIKAWREHG